MNLLGAPPTRIKTVTLGVEFCVTIRTNHNPKFALIFIKAQINIIYQKSTIHLRYEFLRHLWGICIVNIVLLVSVFSQSLLHIRWWYFLIFAKDANSRILLITLLRFLGSMGKVSRWLNRVIIWFLTMEWLLLFNICNDFGLRYFCQVRSGWLWILNSVVPIVFVDYWKQVPHRSFQLSSFVFNWSPWTNSRSVFTFLAPRLVFLVS